MAIEASGTWWRLVGLLERLGYQPVLSHPKFLLHMKVLADTMLQGYLRRHHGGGIPLSASKRWPPIGVVALDATDEM